MRKMSNGSNGDSRSATTAPSTGLRRGIETLRRILSVTNAMSITISTVLLDRQQRRKSTLIPKERTKVADIVR